jgi:DNA-binding NarL/FixJ family response regulator
MLQLAGMFLWSPSVILAPMTFRCVIVDDSAAFLKAARTLLEREGVAVLGLASTGAEALRQIEELRPDVALVDIDLGGESGLDIARQLTQDGALAPSQVILISTHDEGDFADLIAQSPVAGFLAKFDLSATAIRNLLTDGRHSE